MPPEKVSDGQEGRPGRAKPSLGLRAPPVAPLPRERPSGSPLDQGVPFCSTLTLESRALGAWPDLSLLVPQIIQNTVKSSFLVRSSFIGTRHCER